MSCQKRKIIGAVFLVVGVCLITAGIALFLYFQSLEKEAEENFDVTSSVVESLVSERRETAVFPENTSTGAESDETETSGVKQLPVVFEDDFYYVGFIEVPAAELKMAVCDICDSEYLKKGACRYYGSPYDGPFVIAGHNYKSGFGKLKELPVGETILFTTMDGEVFTYEVREIEVLDGTSIEKMIISDYDLSLYTCTYGGKQRFTLRCEKVDTNM